MNQAHGTQETKARQRLPWNAFTGKGHLAAAILLVIMHFFFLLSFLEPAISTPDANGYLVQARLIAREGRTFLTTESPVQYVGFHWLYDGKRRYFSRYPPGLPAITAPFYKAFGPERVLVLPLIMASLTLLGLFLLCRSWIGESWALLAAALMAVNPFANEHALVHDSHTSVSFFLVWGLYCLFQWRKTFSPLWSFTGGLFLGIIPAIHYPEALFLPALAVYMLVTVRSPGQDLKSLAACLSGAALPLLLLGLRNQGAFGAFWKTGYGLSDHLAVSFGISFFLQNFLPYLQKLMSEGCGLLFVPGFLGIVAMSAQEDTWKEGLFFSLLVVPVTALYMAYSFRADPQSMRFLIPTFYLYTAAGVWFLKMACDRSSLAAVPAVSALLVLNTLWGIPLSLHSLEPLRFRSAILAGITTVLEKHAAPGTVVIAPDGINQHLDFLGRWHLADGTSLTDRTTFPEPFYGHFTPRRGPELFRNEEGLKKYRDLKGKNLRDAFSGDLWSWAGGTGRVCWLAREHELESLRPSLGENEKMTVIESIPIPRVPSHSDPAAAGGPPGPPPDMPGMRAGPPGPVGPGNIFDLTLDGKPLLLVKWER
ncbi:MAG: glycosyltransferase family 39 protein [Candidatus Eremiobacteraeota bacterium]|nr:glycosyltransferase family 39 protein [Candidatus Eremiobacteraeota bacterium]